MIQVRQGVFETNSSSTHSICLCMKSDYDAWMNGEVYLNDGWWSGVENPLKDKSFLTKDDVIALIKSYESCNDGVVELMSDEELAEEYGIYTPDAWDERNEYLEPYEEGFVTPNGDEVIAFGAYGHD